MRAESKQHGQCGQHGTSATVTSGVDENETIALNELPTYKTRLKCGSTLIYVGLLSAPLQSRIC